MQLYDRWSAVDDIGSLAVVQHKLTRGPGTAGCGNRFYCSPVKARVTSLLKSKVYNNIFINYIKLTILTCIYPYHPSINR
jgi:hypothetical protein